MVGTYFRLKTESTFHVTVSIICTKPGVTAIVFECAVAVECACGFRTLSPQGLVLIGILQCSSAGCLRQCKRQWKENEKEAMLLY
jgi:hypothetical protein